MFYCRFETVKGNKLCSDPNSPWAEKAKKHLDMKRHLRHRTWPVALKLHTAKERNTVLPKRKQIWLAARKNRWRKPGLRKKQNKEFTI